MYYQKVLAYVALRLRCYYCQLALDRRRKRQDSMQVIGSGQNRKRKAH